MNNRNFREYLTDFVIEHYLRAPKEFVLLLGDKTQKSSMLASIPSKTLWREEPHRAKLISLLRRRWTPQEVLLQQFARQGFMDEVFGTEEDFGDVLFRLNNWHYSREWEIDALSPGDLERAEALEAMTVLTRLRCSGATSRPALNLALANRSPDMCTLVFPMVMKMPIIALRFFLDVHITFGFNAIRRSKHPHADDLIAYLYELLFLQQKVAIALHEYVRLAAFANTEKQQAALINAEVNAIMGADLVFSYLKASVEKTIALVGITYGITGLDAKKTHKAKITALANGLPLGIAQTFYCRFLMEFVASESLDELNSYRSGLLHKKGIADL